MPDGRRTPIVGGLIGWAVPEVMRNVDTNALLDTIDVQAIVDQLDVDAIAQRLDLDALIQRLDVDAIAGRLDLDALIGRLDVDAIAGRLDLDALMKQIDLSQVMGRGTQEIAGSSLDLLRRQVVRLDSLVNRVVDRLLRRDRSSFPAGPTGLVEVLPADEPAADQTLRRRDVSGHYAGVATRVGALALDTFASLSIFGMLGAVGSYLLGTVLGLDLTIAGGVWFSRALLGGWMLLWFWVSVALIGRTPAMLVVGLRVVSRAGPPVTTGKALLRALVEPIATAIFLVGWLGVFIGRERRGLQDVASGTVVVYDWGQRRAEQPTALVEQLGQMIRSNRSSSSTPSVPAA
jgi:uncharacterized RDD family membrane protein YckC